MDDQPQKYQKHTRWETGDAHQIVITPRVLDILHKLFIHGALSNAMLHQLVAPQTSFTGGEGFTKHTKLMSRNPNLLIGKPIEQKIGADANYRPLVYDITPKGIQVLRDFGRITAQEIKWRSRMSFKRTQHDMMVAYLTASAELGAKQDGARFIPWTEMLAHEKCPQKTRDAKRPLDIQVSDTILTPDAIFGIEKNGFEFYFLEGDRATESVRSVKRSSFGEKLERYREIFRDHLYKTHFGIPNARMLTVTISDTHMDDIMEYIEETYNSGTKPFCFKAISLLNPYINKPPATGHIYSEPWKIVRFPLFYMGKE
jgi:Replication-relaxation